MIDKLKDDCCGCGVCGDVCAHNAISFSLNKEGFYFPHIDPNLCTECNACERICPMLNTPDGNTLINSFASYAKCKPKNSSSGGIFSVLATAVLEQSGVVYGAAYDEYMVLKHIRITTKEELPGLCGSKYVQSDCTGVYRQVRDDLQQGIKVLFSGIPCQVAGLRNFLHKDFDNLLLLDLVCHGVPSPGIFAEYLKYCEDLRNKKIRYFLIRDNRDGWDNRFRSTLIFKDGKEEYNSMLTNLWNRIFFSELTTRMNCEHCKFANMSRQGDLTLGDFWGIENANQRMYNKEGVSLLLINTNKGGKFVENVNNVTLSAVAYTNEKEHPNLFHSIPHDSRRSEFMNDYVTNGFSFIANKYFGYNKILDLKICIKRIMLKLIRK